jgi:isopenicillin N synthase-like dioxygenase
VRPARSHGLQTPGCGGSTAHFCLTAQPAQRAPQPYVDAGTGAANDTDSDRARVAREVDEACRTVGFIQILGHGAATEAAEGLAAAIDEFFVLPLESKNARAHGTWSATRSVRSVKPPG